MRTFILLIFISIYANAQEFHFSQFHSNPLSLNPANAGNTEGSRISTGTRIQWPKIAPYTTTFVSYDTYVKKIRGGVGINVVHDDVSNGWIVSDYFSLYYAPQFNLANNKIIVKPGFEAGFFTQKMDLSRFVFADMSDPVLIGLKERTNLLNISTGAIVATKRFYGGFSVLHISSFGSRENPGRINVHAAYTFGNTEEEGFGIAPTFLFSNQSNFSMLVAGFNLKYNKILFGIFIRSQDAAIVSGGYRNKKFRLTYSYDYTISNLTNKASGGSHELMFAWFFNKNQRNPNPIINSLFF